MSVLTLCANSRSFREVMTERLSSVYSSDEIDVLGMWQANFVKPIIGVPFSLNEQLEGGGKFGPATYSVLYAALSGMALVKAAYESEDYKSKCNTLPPEEQPALVALQHSFVTAVWRAMGHEPRDSADFRGVGKFFDGLSLAAPSASTKFAGTTTEGANREEDDELTVSEEDDKEKAKVVRGGKGVPKPKGGAKAGVGTKKRKAQAH